MNDRSRVRAALAAGAALCALAATGPVALAAPAEPGAPVASSSPSASSADPSADSTTTGAAAYRTAGDTRVSGGGSASGGPVLDSGTDHLDRIGPGETRYYRFTLDGDASTAYFSAVLLPPPDAEVVAAGDGIELTMEGPAGGRCGSVTTRYKADAAYPLAAAVPRRAGMPTCGAAGTYVVAVERLREDESAPDRWPVELRWADGAAAVSPTPGGSPSKGAGASCRGALNFAEARQALAGSGTCEDRIRPGETRFYAVPLARGRRLSATAELALSSGQSVDGLDHPLGLSVYNPARGLVGAKFAAYERTAAAYETHTVPEQDGAGVGNMISDGSYYLAVTLPYAAARSLRGADVPLTLRVTVAEGEKQSPTGGAKSPGRTGGHASPPAAAGEGDGGGDDGLRAVAYAGFGTGTFLLLGLGLWTLAARRRAPALAGGRRRRTGSPPPSAW
ncbi:hypothetical protein RKE29_00860 [Streptomyces sp. B1866]|uniref:hypothetical protein n=1 Tax=Streptomyces sp. B1866 TaxID=3075431 RepID=UPI0028919A7D|nr:hypothetical protein [Streptomyces sp. B1866]MDT3395214.1 hypothetical protein [Streptomyces sp. B1866]